MLLNLFDRKALRSNGSLLVVPTKAQPDENDFYLTCLKFWAKIILFKNICLFVIFLYFFFFPASIETIFKRAFMLRPKSKSTPSQKWRFTSWTQNEGRIRQTTLDRFRKCFGIDRYNKSWV